MGGADSGLAFRPGLKVALLIIVKANVTCNFVDPKLHCYHALLCAFRLQNAARYPISFTLGTSQSSR